ncbi:hypothetical protein GGH99_007973 [Coemansia sp. RSA 1285]|nr:hypothetical protein GGH99_007973 [Coemansia sp. RSA 1285]
MLCTRCGRPGHMAAVCRSSASRCYNCSETDHLIKDCPHPLGPQLRECFVCRKPGHLKADCPNLGESGGDAEYGVFGRGTARFGRGGFNSSRGAFRGRRGGFRGGRRGFGSAREDFAGGSSTGERSGFGGGDRATTICHNCGLPNHIAKGCTKPPVKCYVCNRVGHMARFCFHRNDDQSLRGPDTRECYACGKVGHIAAACPNSNTGARVDNASDNASDNIGDNASDNNDFSDVSNTN